MTNAEAECYREQYGESEVEDVLRYLEERKEDGASSIAIARLAGSNIPFSHAVDILKNLEEQGKARRVMKGRLELWYPPLSSYTQTIEQVEDSKIHEVKEPDVPGGRMAPAGPHYDPEQAAEDLAAMPECEGEACTIAPDPILDAPFSERPQGPASGDAPLTTTGLRQWLVDELMALTDRAEARGFRLAANISWGEELSANLTVCKEARG